MDRLAEVPSFFREPSHDLPLRFFFLIFVLETRPSPPPFATVNAGSPLAQFSEFFFFFSPSPNTERSMGPQIPYWGTSPIFFSRKLFFLAPEYYFRPRHTVFSSKASSLFFSPRVYSLCFFALRLSFLIQLSNHHLGGSPNFSRLFPDFTPGSQKRCFF